MRTQNNMSLSLTAIKACIRLAPLDHFVDVLHLFLVTKLEFCITSKHYSNKGINSNI